VLRAACLFLVAMAAGCGSDMPASPTPADGSRPLRVLMLTATTGFRHDSIATARQVLASLAAQTGEFVVTPTESLADISTVRLASIDVLMFALTSGELPLSNAGRQALLDFVDRGGGFVGVHSASDTLHEWPSYVALVGASFKEHPWTQEATVTVEAPTHPAAARLGSSFRLTEEFYTFQENPRPRVQVVLSLDPSSVGAQGDFPLAWAQTIGRGRSFYTALGHFDSTWTDPRFQSHIRGAIAWAGGRE